MLQNAEWAINKWTIQRKWQHRVHKMKKNTTQYVLDTTTQINTNNVNNTWALLQTTGGKDEPNIIFMRESNRAS